MKTDRVVVVTGAAGGMGSRVVERFLANGDTVIAADINKDGLTKLDKDPKLTTIVADVSKEADCQAVADMARDRGGRVDVLVNVAGWFPVQPFEGVTADDVRKVIDVNLTGPFLMIRAIWPLMKSRGWGRIVNIGSASAFEGVADQVPYVSAKAGLFGMTRSLARAMGGAGVTVNVVTPGLTSTPAVKTSMPEAMIKTSVEARALRREEQPEDLIGAIFFLASPDADFISGQTVNVDGGKHML